MRKIILIVFLFCFATTVQSQTVFQRIYEAGESKATYAGQTPDGGFIILGRALIVRTDSNGNTLWSKIYSGTDLEYAHQTTDGGFIWCGTVNQGNQNHYDGIFAKSDSNGNILWVKTLGATNYEFINSMVETSDGGWILAGASSDTNAAFPDYRLSLFKIDSGANLQWTKCFRFNAENSVRQTRDGGYIIAGLTQSGCTAQNGCLVKVDSLGNLEWTKDYCDSIIVESSFTDVQQTLDGGYIISGTIHIPNTIFNTSGLLIKTDSMGKVIWQKAYDGGTFPRNAFYAVQQTSDEGFAAGGYSGDFGAVYSDAFLVKTNTAGDVLWSKVYGAPNGNNRSVSLQLTMDEGFLLAGHLIPPGATSIHKYFYVIKTDSMGYSGCLESNAFPVPWETTFKAYAVPSVDTIGVSMYSDSILVLNQGTEYDFCTFITQTTDYESESISLKLFPNPAAANLVISFSKTLKDASIKILNSLGEQVYEKILSGRQLSIDYIQPGIYFLEVTEENTRIIKKIIVQ